MLLKCTGFQSSRFWYMKLNALHICKWMKTHCRILFHMNGNDVNFFFCCCCVTSFFSRFKRTFRKIVSALHTFCTTFACLLSNKIQICSSRGNSLLIWFYASIWDNKTRHGKSFLLLVWLDFCVSFFLFSILFILFVCVCVFSQFSFQCSHLCQLKSIKLRQFFFSPLFYLWFRLHQNVQNIRYTNISTVYHLGKYFDGRSAE